MAKKKTPDAAQIATLLGSMAAVKKGVKSKRIEIDIDKSDEPSLADRAYKAYKLSQDAEAAFKTIESQLLDRVRPKYEEGAKSGDFKKTLDIMGRDTPGVQVSFKDAFCDIPLDKAPELKKLMGDQYNNFFFEKRDIALKDPDDKTISLLIEKLGQELFAELFETKKRFIATKSDMDRRQFSLPAIVQLALVQHKASIKIRSEK